VELIRPVELESERPWGEWGSRGCDVWDALCAARAGDVSAVRTLLGRDPNLARYGHPLRFAVREGHLPVVELLLEAGADPDDLGPEGETLPTVARDRGHDQVALVVETRRGRGRRTLPAGPIEPSVHAAASDDDVHELRRLLDADPNLVHTGDRKGATPLHRATLSSAHAAITVLLERGADIHARHGAGPGDPAGYAPVDFEPIDLALLWRSRGDVATARVLLAHGATHDLTIAAALGELNRIVALLDGDPGRIGEARPSGKRPLSTAIEFGHDDVARLLLDRGADPNWPEGPHAPLGFGLHSAARRGNRAMVELLLARGADPNAWVDSSGNATSAAATAEVRALLLAHGGTLDCYDLVWLNEDDEVVRRVSADAREADAGCGGVFTAAATLRKRDLVVRLLAAGARVPPVATGCRSYLMEDPEILTLLLEGGMNPDMPSWQHATPLHDLCGRDGRGRAHESRQRSAHILLDAGASITARDEEYRSTPLAWAARNDLLDMVELLLSRGAPISLDDDQAWATPLAWAIRRGHLAIVDRLRAAGAVG
jgi:ankyrin repeat protein